MKSTESLIKYVKEYFEKYKIIPDRLDDIVFEERVKMNCFYCGNYGVNWKCPPKLPDVNYIKMFSEYENHALVYRKFYFNDDNYDDVRIDSSVELHRTMLKLERFLWENNNSIAISFIGGSCKLCKNGCGNDKCNNPYYARSPVEAVGINIVNTAKNYGVNIVFPPEEYIIRIGIILW